MAANGANSLVFDNNGNTLTDENGQTYKYSAWNQEVTVKNAANSVIAAYTNDAQGRRVTEGSGTTATAVYFSDQWQAIEERVSGTVTRQDVWGLGFVNQLIERDDNSVSGSLGISGSGLGERLYDQQDAGWNTTSLVDASGNVVQRMLYSSYGQVTFLTPSWTSTTDAYAQNVLFQGGRLETATGNYDFQRRDYDPTTGTWKEVDPAGYVDGGNTYQFELSNPVRFVDSKGLNSDPDWNINFTAELNTLAQLKGVYDASAGRTWTLRPYCNCNAAAAVAQKAEDLREEAVLRADYHWDVYNAGPNQRPDNNAGDAYNGGAYRYWHSEADELQTEINTIIADAARHGCTINVRPKPASVLPFGATRGMRGRVLTPAEQAEFDAFAARARNAGLQENPYRTGSWGKFDANGKFQEVTRIDVGEVGQPGWRGNTHMHVTGQDGHLPLTTPIPGE